MRTSENYVQAKFAGARRAAPVQTVKELEPRMGRRPRSYERDADGPGTWRANVLANPE